MACGVAAGLLHGELKAQLPHGPYLGLELRASMPVNKVFADNFSPGVSGAAVLGAQIGDNSFVTFVGDFRSYARKGKPDWKHRNIFTLASGFRYNFWNEESAGAFYAEPRIGFMLIGKTANTVLLNPVFGYTFKGRLDFHISLCKTTSSFVESNMTSVGLGASYNIFVNGKE